VAEALKSVECITVFVEDLAANRASAFVREFGAGLIAF
jgi:hypothetical protein